MWLLVNVLLPALAPLVVLGFLKLVPASSVFQERASIRKAFQDGQAGWLGMAFAATCGYDVAAKAVSHQATSTSWLIFGLCVLFLASLGSAMLGTLFPVEAPELADVQLDAKRRYGLMSVSVGCTILAGALLYFNHN